MRTNRVYLILVMIFLGILAISNVFTSFVVVETRNDIQESNQETIIWRSKHDVELEAVKKYIKIVSDVDIDSVVSDKNVFEAVFRKLSEDYKKKSSERCIKVIIAKK